MINTWPSLVNFARLSRRLAGKVNRVKLSQQLVGEFALGVLLVAALAFSPRDGVPGDEYDQSAGTGQSVTRLEASRWEQPSFGLTLPAVRNLSASAKANVVSVSSKALIPTARPTMILIPSLNVHRPVEAVGLDRSGALALPVNLWNAGWYEDGPVPGAPGDAVIEGHAGYPDAPLLFGRLRQLRTGDKIVVVLADGRSHLFLVASVTSWSPLAHPPGLFEPFGPPRLSLITCNGAFDDHFKTYAGRLVVEATYAGFA